MAVGGAKPFRRRGTAMWRTKRPERSGRPRWSPARVAAHAGPVTEQTGAEVRATAADAARQARVVLAALADPDDELTVPRSRWKRWPAAIQWRRLQVEHPCDRRARPATSAACSASMRPGLAVQV